MKKELLIFLLGLGILFPGSAKIIANESMLPEASDPFWLVMSQLDRPDDPTCEAKTEALLASNGIPNEGERAQLTCYNIEMIAFKFHREGIKRTCYRFLKINFTG